MGVGFNNELSSLGLGFNNELSLIGAHYATVYEVENEKVAKTAIISVNQSYGGAMLNKEDLIKIRDWANLNIEQWDKI